MNPAKRSILSLQSASLWFRFGNWRNGAWELSKAMRWAKLGGLPEWTDLRDLEWEASYFETTPLKWDHYLGELYGSMLPRMEKR